MNSWSEPIRQMAAWIDENLSTGATLTALARRIGYSPTYCSTQFHRVTGLTMREFAMQRRLWRAAITRW